MKPRTKREREAVEISDQLQPISEKWKRECFSLAFWNTATQYMSGRCVCRECGKEWYRTTHMWRVCKEKETNMLARIGVPKKSKPRPVYELKPGATFEITTCPHCHKRVRAYHYNGYAYGDEQGYFSVLECVGKYQIIRTFEAHKFWHHGDEVRLTYCGEVSRRFVDMEKGDVACDIARSQNGLCGYRSSKVQWRYDQPMTVKQGNYYGYAGYSAEKYNFACMYFIKSLHPILKRANLQSLKWANSHYIAALQDPHAQTLLEANQPELFELYAMHGGKEFWPQMKICIRHGYKVKDSSIWKDTMRNVQWLGMDDHSPVYVCPQNLMLLHDQLQRRRNRIEAERRRIQQIKEAKAKEAEYAKRIAKYAHILLEGKDLVISPLPTVQAFVEEGNAMHHCVYGMRYYEDKDCLILSARDGAGNRLATIEYKIKTGRIAQCRAACNKQPERDAEIRELILQNRRLFTNTRTKRKEKV